MQLTRARPVARGVDTLMYVGDDGTDAQPVTYQVLTTPQFVGVGLAAVIAPKGKRGSYIAWSAGGAFLWNLLTGKFAV